MREHYESVCDLPEKESPAMQLPSGSTGWIELPNGQRWNPGHTYKFNAHESVQMKGGSVLRFLTTKTRRLLGMVGGVMAINQEQQKRGLDHLKRFGANISVLAVKPLNGGTT